ncbi:MAG TPA: thioredoxin family protein [Thermoanaerobaculia bacterium]|nr:thioredoxin family protein [Thermoanaerobaculia bacterium]
MERRPSSSARAFLPLLVLLLSSPTMVRAEEAGPGGWGTSLEVARTEAEKSGKLILVDLFAEWCGWCKTLERQVFTAPEFKRYAEQFVLLRVDVEDGGEGTRLQARYGATSLPTLLLLDHRLALAGTVTGFAPMPQYQAKIEAALLGWKDLMARFERALKSSDAGTIEPVAEELFGRQDGWRAATAFERMLTAATLTPTQQGWTRYRRAEALRLSGQFEKAAQAVTEGMAEATSRGVSDLVARYELLSGLIALDRGRCEEARLAFEGFLAHHPDSNLRPVVKRNLAEIKHNPAACV